MRGGTLCFGHTSSARIPADNHRVVWSFLTWLTSSKLLAPLHRRTVRCVHCARPFTVAGTAEILTCPACYKRVRVDDVVVASSQIHGRIETCGAIIVRKTGRLTCEVMRAGMGILVEGRVQTSDAAAPIVVMSAGAIWSGSLQAARLDVQPGARVLGGRFRIRADRLASQSLPPLPERPIEITLPHASNDPAVRAGFKAASNLRGKPTGTPMVVRNEKLPIKSSQPRRRGF